MLLDIPAYGTRVYDVLFERLRWQHCQRPELWLYKRFQHGPFTLPFVPLADYAETPLRLGLWDTCR